MQVPIGVPGERGLGSGSGWWWGLVFLWERLERGKGAGRVGGGVWTGKGTGKSMRKLCRNYPLANYPSVSPLTIVVPFVPGFVPRTIILQGESEQCLCVLRLLFFFVRSLYAQIARVQIQPANDFCATFQQRFGFNFAERSVISNREIFTIGGRS